MRFPGIYYKCINSKHRLVYEVTEAEKIVKILSVWSHYKKVCREEEKAKKAE